MGGGDRGAYQEEPQLASFLDRLVQCDHKVGILFSGQTKDELDT